MYDIRFGSQRSHGLLTYDEQYRLRVSVNPTLAWVGLTKYYGHWILYKTPIPSPYGIFQITKMAKFFCFNFKGSCPLPICSQMHYMQQHISIQHTLHRFTPPLPRADKLNRPFRFTAPNHS